MVILCSGTTVNYGTAAGAELTISGFTTTYGGWAPSLPPWPCAALAFSTIIGWGLYGSRFLVFLCRSDKVAKPFFLVYSFVSILGATMDLGLLWSIADTFNGLMSIPNLLALLLLSGTVVRLTKEFFASEADCPQQKEAAALSAKTMCNSLFCYSGRCTGTRATQCTQQSPSLRVKQNTLRNKISPGTRFSCRARSIRTCEKAVARQLSKNIVQNPELFQGQNGSKKVPGL